MQLTRRSLILLAATALPIAASTFADIFLWLALLWLILVLALIIADWQLTPSPTAWEVTRRHDDRLSLAVQNPIEIDLHLRRSPRCRAALAA